MAHKKKAFYTANVREILDKLDAEEISFSRFIELLNEVAVEWAREKDEEISALKMQLKTAHDNLELSD